MTPESEHTTYLISHQSARRCISLFRHRKDNAVTSMRRLFAVFASVCSDGILISKHKVSLSLRLFLNIYIFSNITYVFY